MLKIISGIKKNTNIEQPSSVTRPTMQRVRKTIFDMIFKEVKGKNVLDCFAGSGAMGFEALSIGARKAYFIENDKSAFHVIKSNASKLTDFIGELGKSNVGFECFNTVFVLIKSILTSEE